MRKKYVFFSVAALFVGGLIGWLVIMQLLQVTVPKQVSKSADFTVIALKQITTGFSVTEQPSYNSNQGVVITSYRNKQGTIVLSQQQKPNDVNLEQIDTKEKFLSNVGSVYVLKGEAGKTQAIIETSDSWIYVNADATIKYQDIKSFINGLGGQ